MTAPRALLVGLIALTTSAVARADFPDHDFADHVSIRLRALGRNPFPVYSRTAGEGVVEVSDGHVYTGGDLRVLMPRGYKKKLYEADRNGNPFTWVKAEGWQSDLRFEAKKDMTFVNVGPSVVRVGQAMLRRGDYATYDGSKFARGTFRAPDRVRVEPDDTNRDRAADLLAEARVRLALKQTDEARAVLDKLVRTYPDTRSAADARSLLARRDPKTGSGQPLAARPATDVGAWADEDGRTGEQIAADLLALARVKTALKQYDGARAALRKLMERYPDTREAELAGRLLASFQSDATARK